MAKDDANLTYLNNFQKEFTEKLEGGNIIELVALIDQFDGDFGQPQELRELTGEEEIYLRTLALEILHEREELRGREGLVEEIKNEEGIFDFSKLEALPERFRIRTIEEIRDYGNIEEEFEEIFNYQVLRNQTILEVTPKNLVKEEPTTSDLFHMLVVLEKISAGGDSS